MFPYFVAPKLLWLQWDDSCRGLSPCFLQHFGKSRQHSQESDMEYGIEQSPVLCLNATSMLASRDGVEKLCDVGLRRGVLI
jgi:hypothetical protein